MISRPNYPVAAAGSAFEWLKAWENEHRRPLRVLHIGNIANNAFNNAAIQRQYGVDAYVIGYENYHIMSCPEWEEADFDGAVGDPFFPDWSRVDLGNYVRPRWFTSGPLRLSCEMIKAELSGQRDLAGRLRAKLDYQRWLSCSTRPAVRALDLLRRVPRKLLRIAVKLYSFGERTLGRLSHGKADEDCGFSKVTEVWNKAYPERKFQPTLNDFSGYLSRLREFEDLLEQFDIVQAYSIDGAWPLLAGHPYIAYEHGTLRSIPFENNKVGRIGGAVFAGAEHVFVTNVDCLESADRLGIPPERFSPLPHAFDEKRLTRFREQYPDIKPPDDRVIFFHPARHDWKVPDPSMEKGNDRLIRAFASVANGRPTIQLSMVAWGRDLQASLDLVESLGISQQVTWLQPMRKPDLWRSYLSSHAVLDQFILPAFGGVTFEALALGRRVVTSLDMEAASRFFAQAPPIYQASTEDEIGAALLDIIGDRDDDRKIGRQGAEWIAREHSAERIVKRQLEVYRRLARRDRKTLPPSDYS
jgi:glycosyltransferase involved in cell wall biosynthesis